MAASSNKKMAESKEQVVPTDIGVPHLLFKNSPPLANIIKGYSGLPWLNFFAGPTLKNDILFLASYAAPLEEVEKYVQKAGELKENHLQETLIEAVRQAIKDGDVNIVGNYNKVICEGMAERLMTLYEDLYEVSFPLEQIKDAVPVESKEDQKKREDLNQAAITNLFDTLKKNDKKNTDDAIKTFKDWAQTTSLMNRIHLIFLARVELANRGGELDDGHWGALSDRWCYEVVGDALQKEGLSPRMRQVLAAGVSYIFNDKQVPDRFVDVDASSFVSPPGTKLVVGTSGFYNEFGCDGLRFPMQRGAVAGLYKLITSNYYSIQSLLHPAPGLSNQRAGVRVGLQQMPQHYNPKMI